MRASLNFFRAELDEVGPFFGIMMEAWALTRHDEDVEQLVKEIYQPYLNMMSSIIEEGGSNGRISGGFG